MLASLLVCALLGCALVAGQGVAAADGSGTVPVPVHGADGNTYPSAPVAVPGTGGQLFSGPDFDVACALGGRFRDSLDKLARLADIIERSGRTAVWTLGYNKSSVLPRRLVLDALPHGSCDRDGLRIQRRLVRTYDDPQYLPLADALAGSRRQTYFRTDQHWTTVGGAVFAKTLARRLSPSLARHQKYAYGTEQFQGMLNDIRGIYAPETAETASPAGRVRTATRAGEWAGYPEIVFDHSWTSTPSRRTYPGRTLVVGDSFAWFALENLRPLFRHGRWMWFAYSDPDDVAQAIVDADTVVIEVYQLFTSMTTLTERPFLNKLRQALRKSS
jgi:hypothetical protein